MPDTSDMKDTNTLQDTWSPATLALHGDDEVDTYQDGAPALHFATTFKYPNDHDRLVPIPYRDVRVKAPTINPFFSRNLVEYSRPTGLLLLSNCSTHHRAVRSSPK